MKQSEKTRLMVLTALFAALTFVGTRINFPVGNSRIVHIGDAMIYLAACILPMPYAMFSGAVGAALSDFMTPGCMIWVIPTLLIKPMLVPFFAQKNYKLACLRNFIAVILAGTLGTLAYAIAEGILFGNLWVALINIPTGLAQPIGSAILFIILAYAFDKMKIKTHLTQQLRGNL